MGYYRWDTIDVRSRVPAALTIAALIALPSSDTSNPYVVPGASLHRELELLVEAGLSPRAALAAATQTAAAFLGQGGTLGTLEVGKTADLLVLGADPVASIAAIRQIRGRHPRWARGVEAIASSAR
jgi:imidazolonepropionase-like amidohydrolase